MARHFEVGEFKFEAKQLGAVGISPQRGEIFIAQGHAIGLALRRSATTYGAPAAGKHLAPPERRAASSCT